MMNKFQKLLLITSGTFIYLSAQNIPAKASANDDFYGNADDDQINLSYTYSSSTSSKTEVTSVSSGTVSNDGWKEEFERRVAKCETLKISSGWDSDPDCIGITWEPDTTNQPNQPTPSAADIIYYATTHVQAQGSGLIVQPSTPSLKKARLSH